MLGPSSGLPIRPRSHWNHVGGSHSQFLRLKGDCLRIQINILSEGYMHPLRSALKGSRPQELAPADRAVRWAASTPSDLLSMSESQSHRRNVHDLLHKRRSDELLVAGCPAYETPRSPHYIMSKRQSSYSRSPSRCTARHSVKLDHPKASIPMTTRGPSQQKQQPWHGWYANPEGLNAPDSRKPGQGFHTCVPGVSGSSSRNCDHPRRRDPIISHCASTKGRQQALTRTSTIHPPRPSPKRQYLIPKYRTPTNISSENSEPAHRTSESSCLLEGDPHRQDDRMSSVGYYAEFLQFRC